jgi:hypothetical protein
MPFRLEAASLSAPPMVAPRIFVSVAAYRDPDLSATLQDAVEQAECPEALHLGVLEQSETPTTLPEVVHARAGQVTYLHLHHRFSRGPCWARALIASALRQETHFLQIDSHTRFDPGWDRTLLDTCEALAREHAQPKVILSTYPCAFELQESPGPGQGQAVRKPMPGLALVLRPRPDATLAGTSPVLPFHAVPTPSEVALPGHHVGAGCLFAPARLLQEVPLDPWLYFHGEEQNLAVRAWTHGWDIWHPPDLPVYHLYGRQEARPVHWEESEDRDRPVKWWQLHQQAEQRMAALLFEQADLGVYGLGQARSLGHYAASSGIDYPRRTLQATP